MRTISCYEWTAGTIILPSKEFAPFRQTIQEADHRRKTELFEETQRFWKSLTRKQQIDPDAYVEAMRAFAWKVEEATWCVQLRRDEKPRRVLRSAFVWPTNRTTEFYDGDLSIVFDRERHSVAYTVNDNNHAREWAAATEIGQAFDRQIARVRWAHGTGGVLIGNDEYNRDSESVGGGGNYVVAAYGYLGAKEAPMNTQPFVNSKGERVKVEVKSGRTGFIGTVVPDTSSARWSRW